ncbi:SEL1-like repeat protein [Psychrobacter sp. FDAARGOS_221]|uniref:SEL1-like repeat protein n=1 Tax=Psychrobacter sp. FDAARGOS_221 TaxID=1975705 RepID=UPI000C9EFCC6|nr:SEL1-like repeat protein [Psychrobacter sp. FDAARGOS_221]PNK60815.1 hypothetical protein A6J60_007945 [Psychrobacter sp. FDAARGOS_221]
MAQHNLGFMYEKGFGVEQDISKAKQWYKQACDQGTAVSCRVYRALSDAGR